MAPKHANLRGWLLACSFDLAVMYAAVLKKKNAPRIQRRVVQGSRVFR